MLLKIIGVVILITFIVWLVVLIHAIKNDNCKVEKPKIYNPNEVFIREISASKRFKTYEIYNQYSELLGIVKSNFELDETYGGKFYLEVFREDVEQLLSDKDIDVVDELITYIQEQGFKAIRVD